MNMILDGDRIPDAVFCFNDQLAIGALKAIKRGLPHSGANRRDGLLGIAVGPTDRTAAEFRGPAPRPDRRNGGKLAVGKIKNPDAPNRTVVLDARINIRESTDIRPQQ